MMKRSVEFGKLAVTGDWSKDSSVVLDAVQKEVDALLSGVGNIRLPELNSFVVKNVPEGVESEVTVLLKSALSSVKYIVKTNYVDENGSVAACAWKPKKNRVDSFVVGVFTKGTLYYELSVIS